MPFDSAFAARSAQDFADDVLVGALGATHVSVGENFHFGHRASGSRRRSPPTRASRRASCRSWRSDGRDRLLEPHPAAHRRRRRRRDRGRLLGEPFGMAGEVVQGEQRGRELGYPTANLVPDPALRHAGVRRSTRARERHDRRRGEHRRAPDVRHEARRARRGVPARLQRRSVRHAARADVPASACAASSASSPSRRSSSRSSATSRPRARSSAARGARCGLGDGAVLLACSAACH